MIISTWGGDKSRRFQDQARIPVCSGFRPLPDSSMVMGRAPRSRLVLAAFMAATTRAFAIPRCRRDPASDPRGRRTAEVPPTRSKNPQAACAPLSRPSLSRCRLASLISQIAGTSPPFSRAELRRKRSHGCPRDHADRTGFICCAAPPTAPRLRRQKARLLISSYDLQITAYGSVSKHTPMRLDFETEPRPRVRSGLGLPALTRTPPVRISDAGPLVGVGDCVVDAIGTKATRRKSPRSRTAPRP